MTSLASNILTTKKLDWQYSASELFEFFSDLPWAIFLDSANAQHQDARYDIIALAPRATLVCNDGLFTLDTYESNSFNLNEQLVVGSEVLQTNDPFSAIQTVLDQHFPTAYRSELPFTGGAMGCFSYDLGRHVENIPALAQRDVDFAELHLGFYTWALVYDNQAGHWYLSHYQGDTALEQVKLVLEQHIDTQAFEKTFAPNAPFALLSHWQSQMSQQEYQQKFERIHHYLHAGDCYQINLTQRFEAQYNGDEWQAYLKLRASNQAPFSSFIRLPTSAILSISPERFIHLDDGQIQTKPIKGTLRRHTDDKLDQQAAETLRCSEKDRAENLMIVDLLRNDIGKVAKAGSVAVPHLFEIESFPAVHHLVSTITATLAPKFQACDLLKAAFPGGSITGAPKVRAMEIIEELEPSRRNIYCGSIGYISQDGKMDTSITIRTLLATEGKLYCSAGGGIVADSEMEAEYQESYDKVNKILPVLTQ
ncbi:aminodeoxychorismate synthase component I [Shewanella gelidii]|uniref:aminodeoxychorismate synthase n=1 Tax=Shewanella gelidii TaxID=1642821 RepID=A0A917JUS1_9GAMM|nr:aminodeoxychorismate synthase component I [Shewanella gelidii]MCL1098558.1 aminodeoxychorismate synthase component I [Shewanella gelidii]GGI87168.1 aminodeoxychorismate synthase, component I [Shewanella gelidii]